MCARDSEISQSVIVSPIYGSRIVWPASYCREGIGYGPTCEPRIVLVLRLLCYFLSWQSLSRQGSTEQQLTNQDWIKSIPECVRGFGGGPKCLWARMIKNPHLVPECNTDLPAHLGSLQCLLEFVFLAQGGPRWRCLQSYFFTHKGWLFFTRWILKYKGEKWQDIWDLS